MPDRKLIHLGDTFVTVEIADEAAEELARFFQEHDAEIRDRLLPHGVDWHDVIPPTYQRVIWDDELRYAEPISHRSGGT